ncbi:MAG TPA: tetratricopeptide repeat protein [Hyphomicrobiales bacterium]|nr:tetratricopeptide repeat protein [Hyphomicrobiales bacterium]
MLKHACLVFSAVLAWNISVFAADKVANPMQPPDLELLKGDKKPLREARKDVLSSLYNQLSLSKNAESAELIVSAIDRLWTQSGSDTTDLLMQRAQVALQEQNYDLAIELLQSISEIDPRYVAGWSQLATVYYLKDRYHEAMNGLRRVLALDPKHFKAIEGLGIILRETGKTKAALAVMRRALEIHPFLETAKKAVEELEREVEGQGI